MVSGIGSVVAEWTVIRPHKGLGTALIPLNMLIFTRVSLCSYHPHLANALGINNISEFLPGRCLSFSWLSGFCYAQMLTVSGLYLCMGLIGQ